MKKVIIISAHPDDEVLGCGGTLLKHHEQGDSIYWIIGTNVFEKEGFTRQRVESRQIEIAKISEEIGVSKVFKLDYPTMSLNSTNLLTLIPKISEIFSKVQPEIIYTLNRSDAHSDHRILCQAVASCTKSFRHSYIKKVLMYECISETEFAPQLAENMFIPNYFVDISKHFVRKLDIMRIYKSELGEHPFPRSLKNIEALATFRGATAGVKYAEAFQLIKYIDK